MITIPYVVEKITECESNSEPCLKIPGPNSPKFDIDTFTSAINLGIAFFHSEGDYLLAFVTKSAMEGYKRNQEGQR